MEEEKKKERWSVTYTKHIKQKRKVYHDGFLDLHISTSKGMLYDESEKLLECRMLKKDEVVSSGETLTFASYFVDVGLLSSASHLNSSDARRKSNESRPINRSLSPSQKIIREFKKGELQKYGTQETGPTTTKAGVAGKPQKTANSKVHAGPGSSIPSIAERKASQNISAHMPLRDATQIMSILQKPLIKESIAPQSIVKNIMNPVPSVKEPQKSDSTKNILESNQLPMMSTAHQGSSGKLNNINSSECIDIKISPEIFSEGLDSVAKSRFSGSKSSKNTEVGNLGQADLENSESSYTKSCNEASVPDSSSRAVLTCHERVNVMKDCTEIKNSREAGSFPSFELGFD